jgi:predicted GNAT family acetyltransferase
LRGPPAAPLPRETIDPAKEVHAMSGQRTMRRNDEARRYELRIDGAQAGLIDFVTAGDAVALPHAETLPRYRGQGLAADLTRFALDDIRAAGLRVIPLCPYVAEFIQLNPEYADLVLS